MKKLHLVPGLDDIVNGMSAVARMLVGEQGDAEVVDLRLWKSVIGRDDHEEVWVHGAWLPSEWRACKRVLKAGARLVRMPHGSYDPVRLGYHGWKKTLVGPIERFFLRRSSVVVATCEAEKGWIKAYLGKHCPPVEVTDIKRFFNLHPSEISGQTLNLTSQFSSPAQNLSSLRLLYLGRRHPLKGVECLEQAVKGVNDIELRIVSNAFGEEKEKVWEWCDVLVLPTRSENFGLVIAEALERGKRVITTDGAPAWGDGNDYGGRLIYLKGYREGTSEARVRLLRDAIKRLQAK